MAGHNIFSPKFLALQVASAASFSFHVSKTWIYVATEGVWCFDLKGVMSVSGRAVDAEQEIQYESVENNELVGGKYFTYVAIQPI